MIGIVASFVLLTIQRADHDLETIKRRMVAWSASVAAVEPKGLAERANADLSMLRSDGTWEDIVYPKPTDPNWTSNLHLDRALRMARAYRSGTKSRGLKEGILRALDHWLANDYRNVNWWWNDIGVPNAMGEILLLMEPDLSPEQKAKGVAIVARSPLDNPKAIGANAIWEASCNLMRGLLTEDEVLVGRSFAWMFRDVRLVSPDAEGIEGEGIMPDRSFHQHGRQLYSGGYGQVYGIDLPRYVTFGWGTRYQMPKEKLDLLVSFLLDGQRHMIRGGVFDHSTVGREITRKKNARIAPPGTVEPRPSVGTLASMAHSIRALAGCSIPRQKEMRAFAAYLNDEPGVQPFIGNRTYWNSDYVTHGRSEYLATVRMLSDRMVNSEITNEEGLRSQHLGDGVTYLYRWGDEYVDLFSVWDWQRLPGTTAIQRSVDPFPRNEVYVRGKRSFVGGVSDGQYGAAAFDLDRNGLRARKAWFFGDEGFACLGAGIASEAADNVFTTVNQCRLRGSARTSSPSGDVRWVWHDGVTYAFPVPTQVSLSAGPRSGRWSDSGDGSKALETQDVFLLALDHGARPKSATYAYFVLPNTTPEEGPKRAEAIEILRNDERVQAVRHRKPDLVQAAFYEAGALGGVVTVDRPCLLQWRRQKHRAWLTLEDPRHGTGTMTVRLGGRFRGPGCSPDGQGTTVKITLPDGYEAGRSATVELTQG